MTDIEFLLLTLDVAISQSSLYSFIACFVGKVDSISTKTFGLKVDEILKLASDDERTSQLNNFILFTKGLEAVTTALFIIL